MGTTPRKTLVIIRLWTAIAFNLKSFVKEIESAIDGGVKGCNVLIVDCNNGYVKNANRMDAALVGTWLTGMHKAHQVAVQSDVTDKIGIISEDGECAPDHVSTVQPEARCLASLAVARSIFPGDADPELVILPGSTEKDGVFQDTALLTAYRDAKMTCKS